MRIKSVEAAIPNAQNRNPMVLRSYPFYGLRFSQHAIDLIVTTFSGVRQNLHGIFSVSQLDSMSKLEAKVLVDLHIWRKL